MKKRKSKQRRKEAVGVAANYNFWKRHISPHVERVDLDSLSLNAKGQLRYVFLFFFICLVLPSVSSTRLFLLTLITFAPLPLELCLSLSLAPCYTRPTDHIFAPITLVSLLTPTHLSFPVPFFAMYDASYKSRIV